MRAYLGLSSEPVQVENVTAEGIVLSDTRRRQRRRTIIELINTAGDFVRLVPIQVVRVTARPEGGYSVEGRFIHRLTDEELQALRC